mgnify:CR=1 FL=1
MNSRIVFRASFWIGMVVAAVIPWVPGIYRWFYPPRNPASGPKGFWQTIAEILDSLNTINDSVSIFLWIVGLTTLVVITSLIAIIAAWRAQESRMWKFCCGLPIILAAAMWLLLIYTM